MKKVDGNTTGTYDGILYIMSGEKFKTFIISASGDENDRLNNIDANGQISLFAR